MWHATAPLEAKIAHFQKTCAAYGHKPGTPEMNGCLQQTMESSKGDANARATAIGAAMQQNRAVTCNTIGSTTTCR
jgi:hypothetical protein